MKDKKFHVKLEQPILVILYISFLQYTGIRNSLRKSPIINKKLSPKVKSLLFINCTLRNFYW